MCGRILCLFMLLWWSAGEAFAAHPLVTDDAATQGRGKFQIELGGEYTHKKKDAASEDTTAVTSQLSAGIADSVDLVLSAPCQSIRTKDGDDAATEEGIGDTLIQVKWRFYEKEGWSLAVKPGMTVPTGNDEKGLGTGRITGSLFFIAAKEIEPAAFYVNVGYLGNENRTGQRRDLYYASLAGEFKVAKDLRLVVNSGVETNADKSSGVDPAFILGGVIYSLTANLDIDFGLKGWWNNLDEDYSLLAGLTWKF